MRHVDKTLTVANSIEGSLHETGTAENVPGQRLPHARGGAPGSPDGGCRGTLPQPPLRRRASRQNGMQTAPVQPTESSLLDRLAIRSTQETPCTHPPWPLIATCRWH